MTATVFLQAYASNPALPRMAQPKSHWITLSELGIAGLLALRGAHLQDHQAQKCRE